MRSLSISFVLILPHFALIKLYTKDETHANQQIEAIMAHKKPESLEELELWVQNHQEHGKINGEPLARVGKIEIRGGLVSGGLYNKALLLGAALSLNKSEIGTLAFTLFLSGILPKLFQKGFLDLGYLEATTEFRAYIPINIYNLALEKKEEMGWNNSQLVSVGLLCFVNNEGILALYQQFIQKISLESGLSHEEIQQKIFDSWRYNSRVKRLNLSKEKGEFISDRKLP